MLKLNLLERKPAFRKKTGANAEMYKTTFANATVY